MSVTHVIPQVVNKAPKKVAKSIAGKKTGQGVTAGKKISAKKTALGVKKPVAKTGKANGKKGMGSAAKKLVPKTSKSKLGKVLKK